MLRESAFVLGGAMLMVLGAGFWAVLALAGIGWGGVYLYAYVGLGVGLGAFFVYVGRAERQARHAFLEREESMLPP